MKIIEIILEVLILLIGLYLAFFKSYFQEKGKNLATKEDIGDITNTVEEIKSSFTTEIELFKSNLQFLTNIQIGIASEERNVIIDFNVKFNNWLYYQMDYISQKLFDNVEIEKCENLISISYFDLKTAQTKLSLFCKNEEILKMATNLIIVTGENIHKNSIKFIGEIKMININRNYETDNEKIIKLIDEIVEKHRFYCDENLKKHVELCPTINLFMNLCRNRIYELIENK